MKNLSLATILLITSASSAQVLHGWTAPAVDDGNPIPNFRNSWFTSSATGTWQSNDLAATRALAADNSTGRVYCASSTLLQAFVLGSDGTFAQLGTSIPLRNAANVLAVSGSSVESMGFASGVIVASASLKWGTVIESGLFSIDPATGVATLLQPASSEFPVFPGMDYNSADGFMYAVRGFVGGVQEIHRFRPSGLDKTIITSVPVAAYNGVTGTPYVGLAAGEGKLFLTHAMNSAYGNMPIAVYDIAAGAFVQSLPTPTRNAENRIYSSGATYFAPAEQTPCQADLDGSGLVDGADLAALLGSWGTCSGCGADLDGDGIVGGSDLGVLIGEWGCQ